MSPATSDGLRDSSFDAYLPEKWTSNVYTLERLDVKQRLLSLAKALEPELERRGLTLQRYVSDEYPSLRNGKKVDAQWVFFWRTEEEQLVLEREVDLEKTLAATLADPTPMSRHVFLCLRVDATGLEVSFRLHRDAWVDQRNFRNKLELDEHRESLSALLAGLGAPIRISLAGEPGLDPAACSVDDMIHLLDRHAEGSDEDAFLRVGLHLDRARTIELGAELVDRLAPAFGAVAELYRFVAWSRDNDFVSHDEQFLKRRAERGARRQQLQADLAERQAARAARKREQDAARAELEELFRREAVAKSSAPRRPRPVADGERPRHKTRPPKRRPRSPEPKETASSPKPRPRPKPEPTPQLPQPVQAGHRARVSKGPLAGQIGLVQEVDGKGTARIMVGLLATRVAVDDLIGLGPTPDRRGSQKPRG